MISRIIADWQQCDPTDRLCLALAASALVAGFALGFLTAWGWP